MHWVLSIIFVVNGQWMGPRDVNVQFRTERECVEGAIYLDEHKPPEVTEVRFNCRQEYDA